MAKKPTYLILSSIVLSSMALSSCSLLQNNGMNEAINSTNTESVVSKVDNGEVQISDLTLENNLNNTLESIYPASVYNHNLYAIVWKGKTLLLGESKLEATKKDVLSLAAKVYGVKSIIDGASVNPNFKTGVLQSALDSTITSTVKTAFLITKTIKSLKIKVITQNQVVYLLCDTSEGQAKLAATIAKNLKDVKEVKYLIP